MSKYLQSFLFIILTTSLLLTAMVALAANENPLQYTPQISIPGKDSQFSAGQAITMTEPSTKYIGLYLQSFYNYAIGIVGILGVIVLMYGGMTWLTSGGNPSKITQAKELITGSLIGMVLIMGSWILLNTINPDLMKFKVSSIAYVEEFEKKYCCDRIKGLVEMEVKKNGNTIEYVCPGSQEIQCAAGETCTQTEMSMGGSETKPYICLDLNKYSCCEYRNSDPIPDIKCTTTKEPTACGTPPSANYFMSAKYNNHVCDSDGGEDFNCYSGGKEFCCQCKYAGFAGLFLGVDCQDNLTAQACKDWCVGSLMSAVTSEWSRFPAPKKCVDNDYCE